MILGPIALNLKSAQSSLPIPIIVLTHVLEGTNKNMTIIKITLGGVWKKRYHLMFTSCFRHTDRERELETMVERMRRNAGVDRDADDMSYKVTSHLFSQISSWSG